MNRPESIILEGGDGVGKNTLALALVKHLLANGMQVIFSNFPQYWFFGDFIRSMNSSSPVRETLSKLDGYREAEVRAAMYALDRAFGFNFILNYQEANPNAVLVSDRGPLSNAVTAGFMWSQGRLTNDTIDQFLADVVGPIDQEIMSHLQPLSILCRNLKLEVNGQLHREALDEYEKPKPQEFAAMSYAKMNLPTINTADSNGWRKTEELTREVMSLTQLSTDPSQSGGDITLQHSINNEQLLLVGPSNLFKLSNDLPLPGQLIDTWGKLSLLPESDLMQLGILISGDKVHGDRKTALNANENYLAAVLTWAVGTGKIKLELQPLARSIISRILNDYPEILETVLPSIQPTDVYLDFINYLRSLASLEV